MGGDGKTDIFVCPQGAAQGLPPCGVWYGTGSSFGQGSFTAEWNSYQILAGEFNGDGRADLLVCPPATGSTCSIYYSTGSGFAQGSFTAPWGGYQLIFGDFNGDGKTDIFMCVPMQPCHVYYSTGSGFTQGSFTPNLSG